MLISDLLSAERIRCDVQSSSKKRLLELISEELARNSEEVSQREIFESLCARERLGSTGLGKGVAIPHGRVKGSSHVQASFIRLRKPLPFDAADGEPVDARGLFDRELLKKTILGIFRNYYKGFTGFRFRGRVPFDLDRLSERTIEEMGVDRHMEEWVRVTDWQPVPITVYSCSTP